VDFVERLARHGSREATGSFARITGIPGQERRNSDVAPPMVVALTAAPARRGLSRRGVILATVGSVLILGALIATYVLFGASVEPPVLPPPLPLPPEAPTVRRLVMPRDVPVVRPVR
jgi:hypothetical protein